MVIDEMMVSHLPAYSAGMMPVHSWMTG